MYGLAIFTKGYLFSSLKPIKNTIDKNWAICGEQYWEMITYTSDHDQTMNRRLKFRKHDYFLLKAQLSSVEILTL